MVIVNGFGGDPVHDGLRAARHCHDEDRDTASSGVLVTVGPPAHSLGIGIARPVATIAWPVAIFGVSVSTPASRGPAIGYGACLPPQIDLKADLNNWIAGASVGRYLWPYVRPVAGSSASPRLPKRAYAIACVLLSDRQRRSQRERVSRTARRSPLSGCAVLDGMVRVCCV